METKSQSNLAPPMAEKDSNADTSNFHIDRNGCNDQDTDSEDDQVIKDQRTSADIRAYDDNVLLEDEELDRLLLQEKHREKRSHSALAMIHQPLNKLFQRNRTVPKSLKLEDKLARQTAIQRQKRQKKKLIFSNEMGDGEDGKLLVEMEEGVLNETDSIKSSSDAEEKNYLDVRRLPVRQKTMRRKTWRIKFLINFFILLGISIALLVILKISSRHKVSGPMNLVSNGTALFAPTTILISLDGFRADFLYRGLTPALNSMVKEGFSPFYMHPSFPSVTFPNHYTLVTGLYPESHGVVSNNFWDDEFKEEFYYTKPNAMDPKWWAGEPIWVTAEKQGVRTAVHMWPGSEAHIMGVKPTFLDKFNPDITFENKANRILELLDKKGYEDVETEDLRPQLIALYAADVDIDGHRYGPNSTDIRSTILGADQMLHKLLVGLEQRNLTNIVNVVVVSDHGMATTDINRMVQLDDLVDLDNINHVDGWPLSGLHPKPSFDMNATYEKLSKLASLHQNFDVYLRDVNMPERYHFSKNKRIAPLWIVPKTGWAIVSKEEFDIDISKSKGLQYHPRGLHGYDHEHPLMRAIFVARGPAFPQIPRNRIKPFRKLD